MTGKHYLFLAVVAGAAFMAGVYAANSTPNKTTGPLSFGLPA